MGRLEAFALPGIPEVSPGDDLAAIIERAGGPFDPGDVVVVAHKVVSKSEGAVVDLAGIEPGEKALELAAAQGRDPRQVQVILDHSAELVRAERDILICRTPHGFICANAGVDASNSGAADRLVCLPEDPDASARRIREGLGGRPAVVVADSFGRAWRVGQADVALGIAGLTPLEDWRGRADSDGRELSSTLIAVADEAAGAADLARGKDSREPVVVVRGLASWVTGDDGPGAAALVRPPDEDLFP